MVRELDLGSERYFFFFESWDTDKPAVGVGIVRQWLFLPHWQPSHIRRMRGTSFHSQFRPLGGPEFLHQVELRRHCELYSEVFLLF